MCMCCHVYFDACCLQNMWDTFLQLRGQQLLHAWPRKAPSFYSSHPTITTHHLDAENPPQPLDHFQLKWIQAIRTLYKKAKPSSSLTLNFSPSSLFFLHLPQALPLYCSNEIKLHKLFPFLVSLLEPETLTD
jgi:hypothetical protein